MGPAAVAPGLGTGAVHRLLGGGVGVDRGLRVKRWLSCVPVRICLTTRTLHYHESLLNAEVVVDDLGQGGQAVGGAGGVAAGRKKLVKQETLEAKLRPAPLLT